MTKHYLKDCLDCNFITHMLFCQVYLQYGILCIISMFFFFWQKIHGYVMLFYFLILITCMFVHCCTTLVKYSLCVTQANFLDRKFSFKVLALRLAESGSGHCWLIIPILTLGKRWQRWMDRHWQETIVLHLPIWMDAASVTLLKFIQICEFGEKFG